MSEVEHLAIGIQIVSMIQGKTKDEQIEILINALFKVATTNPYYSLELNDGYI